MQLRAENESADKDKEKDLKKSVEDPDDEQLDMSNFLTLDEVGEVEGEESGGDESENVADEGGRAQERAPHSEEEEERSGDIEAAAAKRPRSPVALDPEISVGEEFIRRVDMFYCDCCHKFLPRTSMEKSDEVRRSHCLSSGHHAAYYKKKAVEEDGEGERVKKDLTKKVRDRLEISLPKT